MTEWLPPRAPDPDVAGSSPAGAPSAAGAPAPVTAAPGDLAAASPAADDERRWHTVLAILIAIAAIFAATLALVAVSAVRDALSTAPVQVGGLAGAAAHGAPPVITLVSTLVQDLALIAGVMVAVAISLGGRLRLGPLGLRMPARPGRAAALVLGSYVLFLAIAAGWTNALGISDRENVALDLGTRDSTAALVGAALLVTVMAPLAEELFFRGFIFGGLRRRGLPVALLVSGAAFGAAHGASSPVGFLLPLAVLGVLLALVYEWSGSLYASIGLHWLNNAVAFGVGDGRVWLVPVVLAGSGLVLVLVLRSATRAWP